MSASSRALLLGGACILALIALFAALWPAQARANPAADAACLHEGVLAEKLALARDKGMTMLEAVATVLADDHNARREQVVASSALLFHRFRRLSAEQAAFEFQLACMDDAQ